MLWGREGGGGRRGSEGGKKGRRGRRKGVKERKQGDKKVINSAPLELHICLQNAKLISKP